MAPTTILSIILSFAYPEKKKSISKVWNIHEAETNIDNKTTVNYSLTRMSTLARLHTPAIYASAVMKASKYAIKTSIKI
jgi:hypothetical protein